MNPVRALTPRETRRLIGMYCEDRDMAGMLGDRAAYEKACAAIAELEAMLPERQYEATA